MSVDALLSDHVLQYGKYFITDGAANGARQSHQSVAVLFGGG